MLDFIKTLIFKKKCPNVQCGACPYFYQGPNHMRRCKLIEKLGLNK